MVAKLEQKLKTGAKSPVQLPADQVVLAYKDLWKVERAFRELKSGTDLRPICHWTDSRVRGHVMVSFLALVLESALQKRLRELNPDLNYRKVMQDLAQLRAVKVSFEKEAYLTRSELQGDVFVAFKAVKTRPPQHMQRFDF